LEDGTTGTILLFVCDLAEAVLKFRLLIDRERCKGCELCVEACATAVLRMSQDLNQRGQHYVEAEHPENCTGCRQCADVCPDAAIEIEREND